MPCPKDSLRRKGVIFPLIFEYSISLGLDQILILIANEYVLIIYHALSGLFGHFHFVERALPFPLILHPFRAVS